MQVVKDEERMYKSRRVRTCAVAVSGTSAWRGTEDVTERCPWSPGTVRVPPEAPVAALELIGMKC